MKRIFTRCLALSLCLLLALALFGCKKSDPINETGIYDDMAGTTDDYVTLGQYMGVSVTIPVVEVTDEDLQAAIAEALDEYTDYAPVTDRAVAQGDFVSVTYTATVDGAAREASSGSDETLELGNAGMIEGFETGLIGAKSGEERTLELQFPADYWDTEVAGKAVSYQVKINSISERQVPEYTDAFVAGISDYASMQEYEANLRQQLKAEKEANAESDKVDAVWAVILENATFNSYPQEEVDKYVADTNDYFDAYVEYFGTTRSQFLSDYYSMTETEFDAQVLEWAYEDVGHYLVVRAIAEKESLSLSEEEYQAALLSEIQLEGFDDDAAFAEYYGSSYEEYYGGRDAVYSYLLSEKVMAYVAAAAVVTQG